MSFQCMSNGKNGTFHTGTMRLDIDGKSIEISDVLSIQPVGKERIKITWQSKKRHSITLRVTDMPASRAYSMIQSV